MYDVEGKTLKQIRACLRPVDLVDHKDMMIKRTDKVIKQMYNDKKTLD